MRMLFGAWRACLMWCLFVYVCWKQQVLSRGLVASICGNLLSRPRCCKYCDTVIGPEKLHVHTHVISIHHTSAFDTFKSNLSRFRPHGVLGYDAVLRASASATHSHSTTQPSSRINPDSRSFTCMKYPHSTPSVSVSSTPYNDEGETSERNAEDLR